MPKNIPVQKLRRDADGFANYLLREARVKAGYTIQNLSEKIGINPITYHSYESLRGFPNDMLAVNIAKTLGREVNELFPKSLREVAREINKERRLRSTKTEQKEPEYISLNYVPEDVLVSSDNSERMIEDIFLRVQLTHSLNSLNYRQREIIINHFGLDDSYRIENPDKDNVFISYKPIECLSKARIQQLRQKALEKLKHRAKSLRPFIN